MELGVVFPHHEIGTDPGAIKAFAQAAEGRTPIWLPGTVINADGRYVVTRNIVGAGLPAIEIQTPATRVELDLNGFAIDGSAGMAMLDRTRWVCGDNPPSTAFNAESMHSIAPRGCIAFHSSVSPFLSV